MYIHSEMEYIRMQTYTLPTLSSMLPGAQDPAQRHHTLTLHTPRFASLAALRNNIKTRLSSWKIDDAYIGRLQLSICEVITNLIKHPDIKPDVVHITLSLGDSDITADIADNGLPFATFDAKCNIARACADAADSLAEGGYGLSCILAQHQHVSYRSAADSTDGFNHFVLRDPLPVIGTRPARGQHAPHSPAYSPPLARKKVFLIDDDVLTQDLYRPVLSQHYDVIFFTHAADALARFTAQKPVLVISDLAMPGMDGVTLRRHLGALEGGDLTPFVFLGNTPGVAHESYITQAGIDDYLCKPVSPERLLAVAARVIERASRFTAALEGRLSTQITALLTPHLPARHKNWSIATRSAAADTGGGDFTIHDAQEDFFMATLADVMGHGLQAKFFAYAYAGYLRSLMRLGGGYSSPSDFLTRISAAVNADSFLDSTIMTCLSFSLDAYNRVTLASAGHPPPWHISLQARPLDIAGPLPGLLGESRYTQSSISLAPREKIVIATDGFWDCWENEHTLATDLLKHADSPADTYADILWRTAYERAQARRMNKDDATLIIIEAGDPP